MKLLFFLGVWSAASALTLRQSGLHQDSEHDLARRVEGTPSGEKGPGLEPVENRPKLGEGGLTFDQIPKEVVEDTVDKDPSYGRIADDKGNWLAIPLSKGESRILRAHGGETLDIRFADDMSGSARGITYGDAAKPKLKGREYVSNKIRDTIRSLQRLAAANKFLNYMRTGGGRLMSNQKTRPELDQTQLSATVMPISDKEAVQRRSIEADVAAVVEANPRIVVKYSADTEGLKTDEEDPEIGPEIAGFGAPRILRDLEHATFSVIERPETGPGDTLGRPDGYGSIFAIVEHEDTGHNPINLDKRSYLLDVVSGQGSAHRLDKPGKRSEPLSVISGQESSSVTGNDNNTLNAAGEFQNYLRAFDVARSNVTDLILPFLNAMINNTNSSIVFDAAWSIYADLAQAPQHVYGPFTNGMNCLDWIEDQALGNETTIDDDTDLEVLEYLTMHQVLLDLYDYAWTNGSSAANASGLLSDMITLSKYLLPTDPSIRTPDFNKTVENAYDDAYFTSYNASIVPTAS